MNDFDDIELDFEELSSPAQIEVSPAEVGQKEEPEKPVSFLSFLSSTTDMEYQKMFDFALDTLQFANKVQIYHWTCSAGFQHEQFEKIYDLLRSFADKLVETVLAYSKKFTFTSKSYAQSPADFDLGTAIMKLEEYREAAIASSKSLVANRSISSEFDEMLAELDKHIGLLRNFQ